MHSLVDESSQNLQILTYPSFLSLSSTKTNEDDKDRVSAIRRVFAPFIGIVITNGGTQEPYKQLEALQSCLVHINKLKIFRLDLPTCGPWLRHCAYAHARKLLNVPQPVVSDETQNDPHVGKSRPETTTDYNETYHAILCRTLRTVLMTTRRETLSRTPNHLFRRSRPRNLRRNDSEVRFFYTLPRIILLIYSTEYNQHLIAPVVLQFLLH